MKKDEIINKASKIRIKTDYGYASIGKQSFRQLMKDTREFNYEFYGQYKSMGGQIIQRNFLRVW